VVKHSNPHPMVKGSSSAIAFVPGTKGHSYVASSCSTAVGHSPPSPMVDGLSPTTPTGHRIVKMAGERSPSKVLQVKAKIYKEFVSHNEAIHSLPSLGNQEGSDVSCIQCHKTFFHF
jgi:hypothetical protein